MRDGCLAKMKLTYTTPFDTMPIGPDIRLRSVHASGGCSMAGKVGIRKGLSAELLCGPPLEDTILVSDRHLLVATIVANSGDRTDIGSGMM